MSTSVPLIIVAWLATFSTRHCIKPNLKSPNKRVLRLTEEQCTTIQHCLSMMVQSLNGAKGTAITVSPIHRVKCYRVSKVLIIRHRSWTAPKNVAMSLSKSCCIQKRIQHERSVKGRLTLTTDRWQSTIVKAQSDQWLVVY